MKNKFLKEIKSYKDLPEPYMTIASRIGIENMLILIEEFGGESVYIPRLTTLKNKIRDLNIKNEYTGYNARTLARKYGISLRRVQQIVKDVKQQAKKNSSRNKLVDSESDGIVRYKQLSLFDD